MAVRREQPRISVPRFITGSSSVSFVCSTLHSADTHTNTHGPLIQDDSQERTQTHLWWCCLRTRASARCTCQCPRPQPGRAPAAPPPPIDLHTCSHSQVHAAIARKRRIPKGLVGSVTSLSPMSGSWSPSTEDVRDILLLYSRTPSSSQSHADTTLV